MRGHSLATRLLELKSRFDAGEIDAAQMGSLKRKMMASEIQQTAGERVVDRGAASPRTRALAVAAIASSDQLRMLRQMHGPTSPQGAPVTLTGLKAETADELEMLREALIASGWLDIKVGADAIYAAAPHAAARSKIGLASRRQRVVFEAMLRQREKLNTKCFSDNRFSRLYADGRVMFRASVMRKRETEIVSLPDDGFGVVRADRADPLALVLVAGQNIRSVVDACFADDKAAAMHAVDRLDRGDDAQRPRSASRGMTVLQSMAAPPIGGAAEDSAEDSAKSDATDALADYFEDNAEEAGALTRRLSIADFFESDSDEDGAHRREQENAVAERLLTKQRAEDEAKTALLETTGTVAALTLEVSTLTARSARMAEELRARDGELETLRLALAEARRGTLGLMRAELAAATEQARHAVESEAAALHALDRKSEVMRLMRQECVNALAKSHRALEHAMRQRERTRGHRGERVAAALEMLGSALAVNKRATCDYVLAK